MVVGSNAPSTSGGMVAGIKGFVDVYGGSSVALTVDDSGDTIGRNFTLTSGSLSGLAPAVIDYGTNVSSLTINAGAGNDTLSVAGTSASTPVTFNGGGGKNTLVGSNSNNTWNITAANAGVIGNLVFALVQNLTGGSANDTFLFSNGQGVTGIVNGGGSDTLNYSLYTTARRFWMTGPRTS